MEDTQSILSELGKFTKTLQYHDWNILGGHRLQLTEGVMYLRSVANCDWLIMKIAEAQSANELDFAHYTLTVANGTGDLSVRDRAGNLLGTLLIEDTDFPLSEIELYCEDDVVMLPSER
jgi:hypothetical protein